MAMAIGTPSQSRTSIQIISNMGRKNEKGTMTSMTYPFVTRGAEAFVAAVVLVNFAGNMGNFPKELGDYP